MTRKRTQSPATPPRATVQALDALGVLARARVLLFHLQADPLTAGAVDRKAADAVTHHRHALEGAWFAGRILAQVGEGAGQAAIDAAIMVALQGGRP